MKINPTSMHVHLKAACVPPMATGHLSQSTTRIGVAPLINPSAYPQSPTWGTWIYSSGFAGCAAIVTALIAAAATISAQKISHVREDKGVRRDLLGFLKNILFWACVMKDDSAEPDRVARHFGEFLARARERDIPKVLNDRQMSALRNVTYSIECTIEDLKKDADAHRLDPATPRSRRDTRTSCAQDAVLIALALHWLDEKDRWIDDSIRPHLKKLKEHSSWAGFSDTQYIKGL